MEALQPASPARCVVRTTLALSLLGLLLGCGRPAEDVPTRAVPGPPPAPARLPDGPPIGFWIPEKPTDGGLGVIVRLGPSGEAELGWCVVVDLGYRVEGDVLTLSVPPGKGKDPTPGKDVTARLRFEGDALVTERGGESVRMQRVLSDEPGSHVGSIVGVWSYTHYTQATAYERYDAQGRMSLRIPMSPTLQRGRWSRVEDGIQLQWGSSAPTRLRIVDEGGALQLRGEGEAAGLMYGGPSLWHPLARPM